MCIAVTGHDPPPSDALDTALREVIRRHATPGVPLPLICDLDSLGGRAAVTWCRDRTDVDAVPVPDSVAAFDGCDVAYVCGWHGQTVADALRLARPDRSRRAAPGHRDAYRQGRRYDLAG